MIDEEPQHVRVGAWHEDICTDPVAKQAVALAVFNNVVKQAALKQAGESRSGSVIALSDEAKSCDTA